MNQLSTGQVALPLEFLREPDRNFMQGGRSFYFFDFDDNVVHLPTNIILFHKQSLAEKSVSTLEYANSAHLIGKAGTDYESFKLIDDPERGSFRNFREQRSLSRNEQPLIRDMKAALLHPFVDWRGPSWDFFMHAVNNSRPISVITARGHHPHTIRRAIDTLVLSRDLHVSPNFLSVYPITHPEVRTVLGDSASVLSTAELKKLAIKRAVQDAFECYGDNPHHRFGMSDDDAANVALIREAMIELKDEYPQNAFFVINTADRKLVKEEVVLTSQQRREQKEHDRSQVELF
jgi:hypothetical protein